MKHVKRFLPVLVLATLVPASQAGGAARPAALALVTAESLNQLVAVQPQTGRVVKRLRMPADPQNVEAYAGAAAVVSTQGGAVTLVDPRTLRILKTIRGFASPHIAAFSPDGEYLYVTDDARGELAVIRGRVLRKLFVGHGAHHLAFSPDQRRVWIALGERATAIAVVDTSRVARPRLLGRIDPHGLAHDLAFTPDGRYVWVTYDDRSTLRVFAARSGRPVATLYAGPPPAHVRFDDASGLTQFGRYAYVTSGNAGTIRVFDWSTRRLVRTLGTPTGSFNLSIDRGVVATASLTRGIVTEFAGGRRRSDRVAPATRDIALVTP